MILATVGFLVVLLIAAKLITAGFILAVYGHQLEGGEGTVTALGVILLLVGCAAVYFDFVLYPYTFSIQ